MEPLIGVLGFVLVVVLLVWAGIYIIDKSMPVESHFPLGLAAVLYKLLPMVGVR